MKVLHFKAIIRLLKYEQTWLFKQKVTSWHMLIHTSSALRPKHMSQWTDQPFVPKYTKFKLPQQFKSNASYLSSEFGCHDSTAAYQFVQLKCLSLHVSWNFMAIFSKIKNGFNSFTSLWFITSKSEACKLCIKHNTYMSVNLKTFSLLYLLAS